MPAFLPKKECSDFCFGTDANVFLTPFVARPGEGLAGIFPAMIISQWAVERFLYGVGGEWIRLIAVQVTGPGK